MLITEILMYRKRFSLSANLTIFLFFISSFSVSESTKIDYAKSRFKRIRQQTQSTTVEQYGACVNKDLLSTNGAECADFCSNLKKRLTEPKRFPWKYVNIGLFGLFGVVLVVTVIIVILGLVIGKKKKPKENAVVVKPVLKPKKAPDSGTLTPTQTQTPTTHTTPTTTTPTTTASTPAASTPTTTASTSAAEIPPGVYSRTRPVSHNPSLNSYILPDQFSLEDEEGSEKSSVKKKKKKELLDKKKLQAHIKKMAAQHKSDTRSSKFAKKGAIFIPCEPDLPPPAVLPDNIILDKVTYDPAGNEMYDIGSNVDDIELESSLTFGTLTGEDDGTETEKKHKTRTVEKTVDTTQSAGEQSKKSDKKKKKPSKEK